MNSPLKKFFVALMFVAVMFNGCEAAEFTREHIGRMMTLTLQNPAAKFSTLPVDVETFRKNFNDFITNFIRGTSAGTDAFMMEKIFLIDGLKTYQRTEGSVFAKNFINKVAIVGLNVGSKCSVLNLFAAPLDDQNDAFFNVLILQAFVNGITPGIDATALLDEINKSPDESATYSGVKYSVTRDGDLNIVTAVAAQRRS